MKCHLSLMLFSLILFCISCTGNKENLEVQRRRFFQQDNLNTYIGKPLEVFLYDAVQVMGCYDRYETWHPIPAGFRGHSFDFIDERNYYSVIIEYDSTGRAATPIRTSEGELYFNLNYSYPLYRFRSARIESIHYAGYDVEWYRKIGNRLDSARRGLLKY